MSDRRPPDRLRPDGGGNPEPDVVDVTQFGEAPELPGLDRLGTLGRQADWQSPPERFSVLRALLGRRGDQTPREITQRIDDQEGVLATIATEPDTDRGVVLMDVLLGEPSDAEVLTEQLSRLENTLGAIAVAYVVSEDGNAGGAQGSIAQGGAAGGTQGGAAGGAQGGAAGGGAQGGTSQAGETGASPGDLEDIPEPGDVAEDQGAGSAAGTGQGGGSMAGSGGGSAPADYQSGTRRTARSGGRGGDSSGAGSDDPMVSLLGQALAAKLQERGAGDSLDVDNLAEALADLVLDSDALSTYVESTAASAADQGGVDEERLDDIHERLATVEAATTKLAERPTVGPDDLEAVESRLDEHDRTLTQLEESIAEAGTADEETLRNLQERVAGLEQKLTARAEDVGSLEEDVAALDGRLTTVETTAEEVSSTVTDAREEVDDLAETVSDVEEELDSVADATEEFEDRIEDLSGIEDDLGEVQTRLDHQAQSIDDVRTGAADRDERLDDLAETVEGHRDELTVHDTKLEELEEDVQEATQDLEQFEVRLTTQEQSQSSLVDRFERELERVEEAMEAVERLEGIEEEFEALRDEVETTEALHEQVTTLQENVTTVTADLRSQLDEELDRLDRLESDVAAVREWQRNLQMVSNGMSSDEAGGTADGGGSTGAVDQRPEPDRASGTGDASSTEPDRAAGGTNPDEPDGTSSGADGDESSDGPDETDSDGASGGSDADDPSDGDDDSESPDADGDSESTDDESEESDDSLEGVPDKIDFGEIPDPDGSDD